MSNASRPDSTAGQVQQILNQLVQPIRLLFDPRHEQLVVLRVVNGAHPERFGIGLDRRQRRLQFVGDVRHELPPDVLQAAQVRDVVQHHDDTRARLARQASWRGRPGSGESGR